MAEKSDKEKKVTGAPEVPKEIHEKHLGSKDTDAAQTVEEPESPEADKKSEVSDDIAENLDDKQTDEAVEDIIRNESDELLEAQDAKTEKVKPQGKKS